MTTAERDWRKLEEQWKREAYAWARGKLEAFFDTEAGFTPHTAGDLLKMLDADKLSHPMAWVRILKSDTASYRERYATVRNILESMARRRVLVMGSTVNAHGREKATTYARPSDASEHWEIQIDGPPADVARARQSIRDWLTLDGSVLDGITGMTFKPKFKSGGTNLHVSNEFAPHVANRPKRGRKPRTTRGGD